MLLKLHLDLARRDDAVMVLSDVFQDRQVVLPANLSIEIEKDVRINEQQRGETVHAVILRHASGIRWNAFLWGADLKFYNSFAWCQSAEKWLQACSSVTSQRCKQVIPPGVRCREGRPASKSDNGPNQIVAGEETVIAWTGGGEQVRAPAMSRVRARTAARLP